MSDIGINYDASTTPSTIGVSFGLSFSNTTLRGTVRDIDNFVINVKPSGNVSEQILSGVAWPIAQTLGAVLPSLGKGLISGYSFDFLTISPSTQNIDGEPLTISVSGMSLSNYQGMLLVQGGVQVA